MSNVGCVRSRAMPAPAFFWAPVMLRSRLLILLSLVVIVPVGFASKFYRGPAHSWVNDSLGGVFYVIFWCLAVFLVWRMARPWAIATGVVAVTCCLEFLQLWHPPFLQLLRRSFIGSTILGTTFVWSDFPYYFLGGLAAWAWLEVLRRFERSGGNGMQS